MKSAAKLVALVVLFAVPSLALASSPPQPETPLFTAIQCAAKTTASPAPQIGTPDPVEKMSCHAEQPNCPTLCPAVCDGTTSCTVQSNSVTCDSVVTSCPYPNCTSTPPTFGFGACDNPCQYCACRAAGGRLIDCMPWC